MLNSPFPYYGPLQPKEVRGRDDLVATISEKVSTGRPTVLIAPRRFGKTTILRKIAHDFTDTTTVVHVDLYELRSWADLAERLDTALGLVQGAARQTLDRLAASVHLNLGVVKATLSSKGAPEPDIVASAFVDLLVDYAMRSPTLLILDEFSSIGGVTGAAGMFRTKLQHHYNDIGLLFAGSLPSTMRLLFVDPGQPFYSQADILDVPPLSTSALTQIVSDGFDGEPPAGLAASIHALTGGHPQRSMQLADAAWMTVQQGDAALEVWGYALETVRRSTAAEHETRFAELPTAEQAVLRLVAEGEPLYGNAAGRLRLSGPSAKAAHKRLVDLGLVDPDMSVVDPLFGDWIRTRF